MAQEALPKVLRNPRRVERVLALAGLSQATALVQQVARLGRVQEQPFSASLYSVLQLDTHSTEAVFGGRDGLRLGLILLYPQMSGQRRLPGDVELMRYMVKLLSLERNLHRRAALLDRIRAGIQETAATAAHLSPTHDHIVGRLAEIYLETLSTITPRIMVSGDPQCLRAAGNPDKIRALLLAGVRAAVLWRQLGGNVPMLFFTWRKVMLVAKALRDQLANTAAA